MASTNPILPEGVVGTEINWKTQLTDEHRQMTVSKILEYMMKYLSDGPQDTAKFKIYASSVEESIFSTATSKTDYWGNIKAKMQMLVSRARQSLPRSSPPGPAYSVEGSLHQVSPLHQCHGHGRQLEMQVEPKMMLQQQKKLDAINGQLNGHQKAVPDLLSQHMSHSINHSEGTSQAIHSVGDDWKEQLYNKLKNLKNLFLPTLAARYQDIAKILQKMESMSHNAFDDMESVLRMVDRTVGKVAGNGSEFAVGEDLAAASTCCYGLKRDVSSQTTQRNRYATSIPVHFSKSGIISDPEASPLESSIATHDNKTRFKVNCNLLEEISEINMQLIETVVEIIQHGLSESGEGTVVRCSYTPVAISSKMKSELDMFSVPPIMSLKLLVPVNYPTHSPEILDKFPSEISMGCEDLSTKAKSKLMLNLRILHQPISLMDIARTWDTCARAVISDIAQNLGGGSFSSTYGTWKELCYPKAYCSGA